jgi:hypothetical protein
MVRGGFPPADVPVDERGPYFSIALRIVLSCIPFFPSLLEWLCRNSNLARREGGMFCFQRVCLSDPRAEARSDHSTGGSQCLFVAPPHAEGGRAQEPGSCSPC